jgi:hypothetical protein
VPLEEFLGALDEDTRCLLLRRLRRQAAALVPAGEVFQAHDGEKPLPDGMMELSKLCCGCGVPEMFYEAALEALEFFAADHAARDYQWVYAEKFRYLAINALDSADLLEHGSTIAGSWLTDRGREALAFLRAHGKDWESKGPWLDSEGCTHGRQW